VLRRPPGRQDRRCEVLVGWTDHSGDADTNGADIVAVVSEFLDQIMDDALGAVQPGVRSVCGSHLVHLDECRLGRLIDPTCHYGRVLVAEFDADRDTGDRQ
jgi:hypothetical protein